jgi:hypothetical protein
MRVASCARCRRPDHHCFHACRKRLLFTVSVCLTRACLGQINISRVYIVGSERLKTAQNGPKRRFLSAPGSSARGIGTVACPVSAPRAAARTASSAASAPSPRAHVCASPREALQRPAKWSPSFFECCPFVCPEPVWVKRSFLLIDGKPTVGTKRVFTESSSLVSPPSTPPAAAAAAAVGSAPGAYSCRFLPSCEKTVSFLSFPHVCPEPVLAKRSFVMHNWLKKTVSLP